MGKEQKIINGLRKLSNIGVSMKCLLDPVLIKSNSCILKKNAQLKNKHKDETCFILGNGPSLKLETRLNELKGYTVFSVNQFYRSDLCKLCEPNYHVIADPLFFKLDTNNPSEKEIINLVRQFKKETKVKMFYPLEFYQEVLNSFGTDSNDFFLRSSYILTDNYSFGFDMTKNIPRARNVVQIAIYCAIYMGFKKIVLLGCDMTGLLDNFIKRSISGEIEKFSHVYEYSENERNRMKKVHLLYDNEFMLNGFAQMFHDYRIIRECCNKNGIVILNATKETALDLLEYTTLEEVLDC